ncbi:MAG TPA: FUSC family protein [Accumulibacter sp.]|mgnify:CR=1 FL=1|uniref:FUSC family protein n=1 Tax=Accumulibacter sp. TaxID=2053492 RepID=UPI0025FA4F5E|nr:FUSC family protein [Accumulibacter sp.]MCM8598605.1 FUSC family protein [Accumulibacter sp.]MCM8663221.1 FUSC family protein [Accumulibacter sp.]HNC52755.1 FUSC family protein [Accumulibacter sp.]
MSIFDRFREDARGIHYAANIFIATTVLWILVEEVADENPIWAISSMVATSDPMMKQALLSFRGRIINTLLGCATGVVFLALGRTAWKLPFAMAATVLLSSYVVRMPTMWRQAPITAAIVIAGGLAHHDKLSGFEAGLHRVAEVLFGCVVGIAVAWLLSRVWPLPESGSTAGK